MTESQSQVLEVLRQSNAWLTADHAQNRCPALTVAQVHDRLDTLARKGLALKRKTWDRRLVYRAVIKDE